MSKPLPLLRADDLPYRPNVGIMLINSDGLIWVGCRPTADEAPAYSWQMPQGGIDPAEDPAQAALRELAEETGTNKAEIIAQSREWHYYDLPAEQIGIALKGKYRGQRQRWFAMRFRGCDTDFNIDVPPPGGHEPEFIDWRWARADEVVDLIVDFKRPVYQAVVTEFRTLLR